MPEQATPQGDGQGSPPADPNKRAESLFGALLDAEVKGASKTPQKPAPVHIPTEAGLQTPGEDEQDDTADAEPVESEEPEETPPAETDEVESDEDAVAETDEEDDQPPTRSRKVKLPDGKEVEVTEDEAYNGWMRTQDYTRKTQALANSKREFEAQVESELKQTREQRAKYLSQIEKLDSAMKEIAPDAEPDWDELRAELPQAEYLARRDDWDRLHKKREKIAAERTAVLEQAAKDAAEANLKFVEQETARLIEQVPEWADESKKVEGMTALVEHLHKDRGFPIELIAQVADHKLVLMARDAMRWHQLQQERKTKKEVSVQPKVKPAGPSGKPTPKKVSRKREDFKGLRASRGTKDNLKAAARVMEHFLDD